MHRADRNYHDQVGNAIDVVSSAPQVNFDIYFKYADGVLNQWQMRRQSIDDHTFPFGY